MSKDIQLDENAASKILNYILAKSKIDNLQADSLDPTNILYDDKTWYLRGNLKNEGQQYIYVCPKDISKHCQTNIAYVSFNHMPSAKDVISIFLDKTTNGYDIIVGFHTIILPAFATLEQILVEMELAQDEI